jgi:hypothetical protein
MSLATSRRISADEEPAGKTIEWSSSVARKSA